MNDKKRILFVDDDDLVLSCFQRLLGRRFRLDVASSAAEALLAIEANGPYSIVVTDMRMPGMSGLQLLRVARQASPETIGVLMSGNPEHDDLVQAVSDGIVLKVLQKPFPSNELVVLLEKILAQHDVVGVNSGRLELKHHEYS